MAAGCAAGGGWHVTGIAHLAGRYVLSALFSPSCNCYDYELLRLRRKTGWTQMKLLKAAAISGSIEDFVTCYPQSTGLVGSMTVSSKRMPAKHTFFVVGG